VGVHANPPGFHIDESSIAYNAHTVSLPGRDECGEAWPLYFRAFGDYKNPTYVYMLAAVFRVTGPGGGELKARGRVSLAGRPASVFQFSVQPSYFIVPTYFLISKVVGPKRCWYSSETRNALTISALRKSPNWLSLSSQN
jgi:hypothetical protein